MKRAQDRTGQEWRCYRVVETVPRRPQSRYHRLKCLKCGAMGFAAYSSGSQKFSPIPCDCGDMRILNIKPGYVRNNKRVLNIGVTRRKGKNTYHLRLKCLNCGNEWNTTDLNYLRRTKGQNPRYCRKCKGDALMVRYQGKSVGTWKIVDEERINNTMTCRCNICGHKIVLERKHIGTLKKRRCPACLEKRNSLHRNKVMYVLFSAGYSYDAIADYFGIKRITAKEKIVRERERFVPPDILVPRPDYRDKPGKEIRKKIKKSRAKG